MKKISKLNIAFLILAAVALCAAGGGLLAMYGLRLPVNTLIPRSITFCLMMAGPLVSLAIAFESLKSKFSNK